MVRSTPKVIGIDFDGTLTKEVCFTVDEVRSATPNYKMIELVNEWYESHFIVIYTARRDFLINDSIEWLRKYNVRFHAFSNNKVPFDALIDDKAYNVNEFL